MNRRDNRDLPYTFTISAKPKSPSPHTHTHICYVTHKYPSRSTRYHSRINVNSRTNKCDTISPHILQDDSPKVTTCEQNENSLSPSPEMDERIEAKKMQPRKFSGKPPSHSGFLQSHPMAYVYGSVWIHCSFANNRPKWKHEEHVDGHATLKHTQ